jgi:hypothetical protein
MRHAYWFDAIAGLTLILVPFLAKFTPDWRAVDADIAVGLSLLAWAIVCFLAPQAHAAPGPRPGRG